MHENLYFTNFNLTNHYCVVCDCHIQRKTIQAKQCKTLMNVQSTVLYHVCMYQHHCMCRCLYLFYRKRRIVDTWSEPQSGDRVSYVIVCGSPGQPLYQLVREPELLLANPQLKVNTLYYLSKVIIPPLNRRVYLL